MRVVCTSQNYHHLSSEITHFIKFLVSNETRSKRWAITHNSSIIHRPQCFCVQSREPPPL